MLQLSGNRRLRWWHLRNASVGYKVLAQKSLVDSLSYAQDSRTRAVDFVGIVKAFQQYLIEYEPDATAATHRNGWILPRNAGFQDEDNGGQSFVPSSIGLLVCDRDSRSGEACETVVQMKIVQVRRIPEA